MACLSAETKFLWPSLAMQLVSSFYISFILLVAYFIVCFL